MCSWPGPQSREVGRIRAGVLQGSASLPDVYNHCVIVIVIDPHINAIVWQYGITGVTGSGPGYLTTPAGIALVPPKSLLSTHSTTMGPWPTAPTK